MYRHILADTHPGWELYLAVPQDAYYNVFSEPLGQLIITRESLCLLVFDQIAEVLVQWSP
jgi:XisH protein